MIMIWQDECETMNMTGDMLWLDEGCDQEEDTDDEDNDVAR